MLVDEEPVKKTKNKKEKSAPKEITVSTEEQKAIKDKKEGKTSAPKKEEEKEEPKNNVKYWENEEPIYSETEGNEIRFYEEAGKFQLFNKLASGKISRGVTIDVAKCTEKDAMKVVANMVYAFKSMVNDDRFASAIELLETINMEVNTEDYSFDDREQLEALEESSLKKIAKNMGIKIKLKNKKHMIDTILERQEAIDADLEMEQE